MTNNGQFIPVEIDRVQPCPNQESFLVGLKEPEGKLVSVTIGKYEGMNLDAAKNKLLMPRPNTHKLLLSMVEKLKGEITGLVIHTLEGDTFHAELTVQVSDEEVRVDCRPSDGMVVAILSDVEIYMAQGIIDAVGKNLEEWQQEIQEKTKSPSSVQGIMFTDQVKAVMQFSREESARLGHNYIGTEHLLLGVIKEGQGKAIEVLTNRGLGIAHIKQSLEAFVATSGKNTTVGEVPFTPRAKQILEVAADEAKVLGHAHVGAEHILLALARDRDGVAAQVLAAFKIDYETVRYDIEKEDKNRD